MDLKNKTILITGGTGSFGKAFSKELLRKYKHKTFLNNRLDELTDNQDFEL